MKCRLKNKKYEEIRGDDDEFKYDAFLSHSSKDEDWILTVLHSTLENPPYNYKLCLDYRDFIIGETIADNIVDAVQKSRKTVFILTKSFIESEWCYFELEMVRQQMFDEHRDLAILIMKENLPTGDMPGLLKYLMRKGNYIEWSDNKHGQKLFWSKLDAALRSTKKNMV
uniref:Toll-like receptor 2 type-2-like n=1 Tax=Saccoglossus kowalevskii TaxID=10224 RepID=A0ABM0H119_SACKO|nr:PREDICTED: toll-like receptor 2 type-2-like [Saccoglossus kowalevskii]